MEVISDEATQDKRNVTDEFRGKTVEDIRNILYSRRNKLHIAIENLERDFNAGTIVRTANAFNVDTIHFIGRKQWNKRGAMVTDKYMHIVYHASVEDFLHAVKGMEVIGIDNIDGSKPLASAIFPQNAVLVFGSEANGLSSDMIKNCKQLIAIEQFGSTRSVNVGVASGIAMYCWLQQNVLQNSEKTQNSY